MSQNPPAGLTGRAASLARRQALSAGKAALPPATERQCQGKRAVVKLERVYSETTPTAVSEPITATAEPVAPPVVPASDNGSCREQARARRALLSKRGRGDAPPAPPSRPTRKGTLDYAPKVAVSETQGGQRVTGSQTRGNAVTGQERGAAMPISGTQYNGVDSGGAWRSGSAKAGRAKTPGGLIVSGTLVRSKVGITGDEFGSAVTITGEADQRIEDDMTTRLNGFAGPQFQRLSDPHGQTVFGTNLGRSGRKSRQRRPALEATETGLPVTGSAVGRSVRVTGDEDGACRPITGDQYFTPATRQAECGASSSGSAARLDPVTGGKVSVAQSWGRQKITGADVEHNPFVTGDAPGSCLVITGSQYQGPETIEGWCDDAAASGAFRRLGARLAAPPVTGDAPVHDASVTGTARGAARDITGTPYYRNDAQGAVMPEDPVSAIDERFSVVSPQRRAQLKRGANGSSADGRNGRVTGSFAVGQDKITGNTEFLFRPRALANGNGRAGHAQLTGEGRIEGSRITGDAWSDHSNVTGTEGATAAGRNPSERAGEPKNFAGSGKFKALAEREDPKQLVTGMFYFSKSGAKVTLSGGAQG